jgi:hypothetical protein
MRIIEKNYEKFKIKNVVRLLQNCKYLESELKDLHDEYRRQYDPKITLLSFKVILDLMLSENIITDKNSHKMATNIMLTTKGNSFLLRNRISAQESTRKIVINILISAATAYITVLITT